MADIFPGCSEALNHIMDMNSSPINPSMQETQLNLLSVTEFNFFFKFLFWPNGGNYLSHLGKALPPPFLPAWSLSPRGYRVPREWGWTSVGTVLAGPLVSAVLVSIWFLSLPCLELQVFRLTGSLCAFLGHTHPPTPEISSWLPMPHSGWGRAQGAHLLRQTRELSCLNKPRSGSCWSCFRPGKPLRYLPRIVLLTLEMASCPAPSPL